MGRRVGHEKVPVREDTPFYLVLDGVLHISEKQDPFRDGKRNGLLCNPDKRGVKPFTTELVSYDIHDQCQNLFDMIQDRIDKGENHTGRSMYAD